MPLVWLRDLIEWSLVSYCGGQPRSVTLAVEVANLTRIRSTYSFWFAWTDYYPDTELYR